MLPRSSPNVRSGPQRRELGAAAHAAGPDRARRSGGRRGGRRPARRAGRPAPGPRRARARRASRAAGPWPSAPRRRRRRAAPRPAPPSRTRRCRRARGSSSCVSRSPAVETITSSAGRPSSATTRSACHRASALPRVATRNAAGHSDGRVVREAVRQVEERGQRVGVQLAARGAGRVLEAHGRLVEQLVDDAAASAPRPRCGPRGRGRRAWPGSARARRCGSPRRARAAT